MIGRPRAATPSRARPDRSHASPARRKLAIRPSRFAPARPDGLPAQRCRGHHRPGREEQRRSMIRRQAKRYAMGCLLRTALPKSANNSQWFAGSNRRSSVHHQAATGERRTRACADDIHEKHGHRHHAWNPTFREGTQGPFSSPMSSKDFGSETPMIFLVHHSHIGQRALFSFCSD